MQPQKLKGEFGVLKVGPWVLTDVACKVEMTAAAWGLGVGLLLCVILSWEVEPWGYEQSKAHPQLALGPDLLRMLLQKQQLKLF